MDPVAPPLKTSTLTVAVNDRQLVTHLEVEAAAGEMIGLLGPNGVGKTLTLHTLAGLREPAAGDVFLAGKNMNVWQRRAAAREVALLMQSEEDPFPATVLETALIGRHPHLGFWRWESGDDVAAARDALQAVDLAGLEQRAVGSLSGGERRRLAVAAVLTQDPRVFLLDEPVNHLDPHHQLRVLKLFRALAASGRTVIVSLHDATLAARFSDSVLLLFGEGSWKHGPTLETLTTDNLYRLYKTPFETIETEGRRLFFAK